MLSSSGRNSSGIGNREASAIRDSDVPRCRWKRGGTGSFITPEELDSRKPTILTAAVEQLPTVRIRPPPFGLPLNRNLRIEDRSGCPFTVYLDRIRIASKGEYDVNQIVIPTSVAGIELYPRAIGAPPEYQANNGTCGIVLIWTK